MDLLEQFRAYNAAHNDWPLFFLLLAGVTAGAVLFTRRQ
jgi:hypothetical protein